jgi:hypothetical protein
MRFATGIDFDNRLLEAILPRQLPQGVVHDGILPMSFETISTLEKQLAPAWEGMYEGLQILQLFTGDFGGLDRAFAVAVSTVNSNIEVWELTKDSRTDNQDSRVIWNFELPAFTFSKEFELKRLVGGEVWLSKVFGAVKLLFEYRTDGDPCWRYWHEHEMCVAKNCEEDQKQLSCYPYPGPETYREGYKWTITLPKPPVSCNSMGERPTDIGYQFQMRVTIQGWAQVRGVLLYATPFDKALYGGLKCM